MQINKIPTQNKKRLEIHKLLAFFYKVLFQLKLQRQTH